MTPKLTPEEEKALQQMVDAALERAREVEQPNEALVDEGY